MTKLVGQDGSSFVTPTSFNNFGAGGNAMYYTVGYTGTPGVADTAWIHAQNGSAGRNIKVCLYDAGGNLVATSGVFDSTSGLQSQAISATITAQTYKLVATISTGQCEYTIDNGSSNFSDNQNTAANFSYTSPPATLPAADSNLGHEFIIYLTGSAGGVPVAWLRS